MKSTTTYLHFNGNCRTAIAFYRQCFGGELEIMAFPDASGKPDPDPKAPVMHSKIAQGGQALLMASDYPPGTDKPRQDNDFSVFIDCSSDGELDELFTALSQDGKVTVPPSDMPSGRFGMCDDSFGISWILNCAKAG
jgi:PhnB protein